MWDSDTKLRQNLRTMSGKHLKPWGRFTFPYTNGNYINRIIWNRAFVDPQCHVQKCLPCSHLQMYSEVYLVLGQARYFG
jgi:hypothetical protein